MSTTSLSTNSSILPSSMTAIFWLANSISNHQNLISLDYAFIFHIWHNRKTDQLRTLVVHIPKKKSESHASYLEMMVSQRDLWKIMLWHYVWGQFLSDQSLNAFKNWSNIFILCIYSITQQKKHENVKKYNFLQMISCWDICHLSGC